MENIINSISCNYDYLNFWDFENRYRRNSYKNLHHKENKEVEKCGEAEISKEYAIKSHEYENIFIAAAESICGSYRKDCFITKYNDIVAQHYGLIFDIRI